MLYVIALAGVAVFGILLWCTVTVARIQDIPAWRRFLPLTLFLLSFGASLLRAFGLPDIANAVAFPLNLAVILLSVREIRAKRRRNTLHTTTG